MQFLNNDMDDLMRRAAAQYDPAVSGENWEGVAQKLDIELRSEHPIATNSRRYGLLFLFLLSSLVCNKYLYLKFNQSGSLSARAALRPIVNESIETKIKTEELTGIARTINLYETKSLKNISKPFYRSVALARIDDKHLSIKESRVGKMERIGDSEKETKILKTGFIRNTVPSLVPFTNMVLQPNKLSITAIRNHTSAEKMEEKRFYAGMVAGLDASTVKFNQMHTGWQGGVTLGFQLNKQWAVETGLLWAKKSYYADGKDFNTSKITLPSHSNIIHAEGYCHMFEIPLQVKYSFNKEEQKGLFATAGASSYIMQKEEYDYLYERYNVQYYSNKYYKTSSKHFMATLNLTAGYQHKLRQGTFRLEPYIKLPVQKMGIGNLPITSVGLQAGLTYPIR